MMDLTKPVNNLSELGCMTSFSVTRKTWRVLGADAYERLVKE